jgi:hypothetical protein
MKPALRLVLPLPFLLICLPAQAQAQAYEAETGPVMICDTQKQVERFAQLFDGDMQVAMRAINDEEHNPNACAMVDATYVEGPEIGVARSGSHTFRIVPIVVVAADTSAGYRVVEPALFFTPVPVVEYAV